MPDNKPNLDNIKIIFRTLAIDRGMPDVALKYLEGLGLSKKDYNKVISQGVSKDERNRATEIVMGISNAKQGFITQKTGTGSAEHPLDPAVDVLRTAGREAKRTAKRVLTGKKTPRGWDSVGTGVKKKPYSQWGTKRDQPTPEELEWQRQVDEYEAGDFGLGRYEDGRSVTPGDIDDFNMRDGYYRRGEDDLEDTFVSTLRKMGLLR